MRWRTGRGPLPHSPPRRHRILRREAPQRSVRGQVIRLRQRGPSWLIPNDQFADKPFVFDNEDLHGLTPFTEVSLASRSFSRAMRGSTLSSAHIALREIGS